MADVSIYLPMLKALLQILIYSFVRDLAQQGQIRDTNFLLLRDFERSLLDLRLPAICAA